MSHLHRGTTVLERLNLHQPNGRLKQLRWSTYPLQAGKQRFAPCWESLSSGPQDTSLWTSPLSLLGGFQCLGVRSSRPLQSPLLSRPPTKWLLALGAVLVPPHWKLRQSSWGVCANPGLSDCKCKTIRTRIEIHWVTCCYAVMLLNMTKNVLNVWSSGSSQDHSTIVCALNPGFECSQTLSWCIVSVWVAWDPKHLTNLHLQQIWAAYPQWGHGLASIPTRWWQMIHWETCF